MNNINIVIIYSSYTYNVIQRHSKGCQGRLYESCSQCVDAICEEATRQTCTGSSLMPLLLTIYL